MVKITEPKVTISTNIVLMLLTLFLRLRRVEVDCIKQAVTITTRTLYFFKNKTVIPFADIQSFDYTYKEVEEPAGPLSIYRNSLEIFTISVITKDKLSYQIAVYYGRGSNQDFDFFESTTHNYSGRGGDDSRELIDVLSEGTGIPVNKRISKITDYKDMLICAECGRSTKNTFRKCQYCGGELC